jgi:hypothetical protein
LDLDAGLTVKEESMEEADAHTDFISVFLTRHDIGETTWTWRNGRH